VYGLPYRSARLGCIPANATGVVASCDKVGAQLIWTLLSQSLAAVQLSHISLTFKNTLHFLSSLNSLI
jgi:hypothetical protein